YHHSPYTALPPRQHTPTHIAFRTLFRSAPAGRSAGAPGQRRARKAPPPMPSVARSRPRGRRLPPPAGTGRPAAATPGGGTRRPRSEEHTSELQSREKLGCRLLLEKKKKR